MFRRRFVIPFTPYHFGPSGFIALVFRKWIDLPVFVLANVAVDVEVLFADKWPQHRHWHWHTLLVGAAVGLGLALAMYPFRNLLKKVMTFIHIPSQTSIWKLILSGVLGAWLHVLFDSFYHYDVQPFWPYKQNPLWRWKLLDHDQIQNICVGFFVAAVIVYIFSIRAYIKRKK